MRSGPLRVRLWPEAGGRITALSHEGYGDILVPMDESPFDPEIWPKAGAYPLIPFHNRIRGGRFSWDAREYGLPLHPSEPNALHGFSSRRAWTVRDMGPDSVVLTLTHAGDRYWPWPILAEQHIALQSNAITVQLSVRNDGDTAMPAGLGWHPFFVKAKAIVADARLSWPLGEDLMPLGTSLAASDESGTRYLSNWQRVDLVLQNGAKVTMTAEPLLSHLVIHDVAVGYSCVEPVSHLANALCTPLANPSDRMYPLAPGQTLSAAARLDIC